MFFYRVFTGGGISIVVFWCTALLVVGVLCTLTFIEDMQATLRSTRTP